MSADPGLPTHVAEVGGARLEYRWAGTGDRTLVVLHGGHMSARCGLGEDVYAADASVLVVSRPGYGRTEVAAGPSVPEFAVRLAAFCRQLGLERVTVAGISLGARSALTLAAFYPGLVERVVLLCPVSFAGWPPARSRRTARTVFNPVTEHLTWALLHRLLRADPGRYLPRLLTDLSSLPGEEVVRRLGVDRSAALDFLLSCRSGRGFTVDLRPPTDVSADVSQPTLILASPHDGSVSRDHPERLAGILPAARLVEVDAPCHLLWLGKGAEQTAAAVRDFLPT